MIWGVRFDNYAVHILIPWNTEIGEPQINKVGDKSQDKNGLIIHSNIIEFKTKPNYWYDSVIWPSLMGQ